MVVSGSALRLFYPSSPPNERASLLSRSKKAGLFLTNAGARKVLSVSPPSSELRKSWCEGNTLPFLFFPLSGWGRKAGHGQPSPVGCPSLSFFLPWGGGGGGAPPPPPPPPSFFLIVVITMPRKHSRIGVSFFLRSSGGDRSADAAFLFSIFASPAADTTHVAR